MAKEKITRWNVLDGLRNDREIAAYLEAALEEGYGFFLSALDDAARARGINAIAKRMGVNRQSLYKSFGKNKRPNFETVFKAIDGLGLQIHFTPRERMGVASA